MKVISMIPLVILASATLSLAAGPVDGEIGAVWWATDFSVTEGSSLLASEEADSPGYRGELWIVNRYGLRAAIFDSNLEEFGIEDNDYMFVDLLWRPFSPTENSFVAVGAGWQEMSLSIIGLEGDTSGARLSLEGRIGLPMVPIQFYGQAAYLPELADANTVNPTYGRFEEMTGSEYEAGVSWKVFPFVSLKAGYRKQTVEFTRTGFDLEDSRISGEAESSGVLAGLSFSF